MRSRDSSAHIDENHQALRAMDRHVTDSIHRAPETRCANPSGFSRIPRRQFSMLHGNNLAHTRLQRYRNFGAEQSPHRPAHRNLQGAPRCGNRCAVVRGRVGRRDPWRTPRRRCLARGFLARTCWLVPSTPARCVCTTTLGEANRWPPAHV